MEYTRLDALALVMAHALRDNFDQWRKESCRGMDPEIAWVTYAKRLTLSAEIQPGRPTTLAAKLVDHRLGKNVETQYVVEGSAGQPRLFRP